MSSVQVVAAVIQLDDRFLACRRTPARGGLWEFPGGKVEATETLPDALRRELKEELGIEVRVLDAVAVTRTQRFTLTSFRAELLGAPPMSSTDHDELRWETLDELSGLNWSDADLDTLRVLGERQDD